MSFDGILLNKLKDEFNILKTGRINKVSECGDADFVFTIRAQRTNYNLLASFSSTFARIHLTEKPVDNVPNPKSFTMFLRKHIEGFFIEDIKTYHSDRIIYFVLAGYNEIEDFTRKYLICEVMGRYSNLILTDDHFKIIEALKHDGIGEYNRTIMPNATYTFPPTEKLNPFDYTFEELESIADEKRLESPKDYLNTFNGLSKAVVNYLFKDDMHEKNFYELLHTKYNPSVFKTEDGKTDFYFDNLDKEIITQYESISTLLDNYYYRADLASKIKLKTDDLLQFVTKHIVKNTKKIEKLEKEKEEALDCEDLKLKGELLLSYPNLKEKHDSVIIFNYYTGQDEKIELDNKISIIDNSQKYYKKYQKTKGSIAFIDEQLQIAKDEIEYFTLLKYQLADAQVNEALQIQDELIEAKYLFKKTENKGKKQKPKPLQYVLENGTVISVGKNNIQNEYVTHKLAKPNEMWFHIQKGAGSHVVVHKEDELSEEEIRTAAILASFYSTYKDSSSVAVDYTRVRNIKKIPGKKSCFVTYKAQHTIYIDPDSQFIEKLKVKK